MKQKSLLSIFAVAFVITLVFSGCSDKGNKEVDINDAFALVGEEYITNGRLNDRIQYTEIFNEGLLRTLKESGGEDMYKDYALPTDKEDIKKEMIRYAVVRTYLKDDALNYEKAAELTETEIKNRREEDNPQYAHIMEVLKEKGITEQQYKKLLTDFGFDFYNYNTLKQEFSKENFDSKSDKTLNQQFETYVDDLVKKAEIKRFD